jgi:serine/threonine protein kinase
MIIIGKKYNVTEQISSGHFGTIYIGKNIMTHESIVIKMEKNNISLKHETRVLNYLYSKHCRKIPPVYWYGKYSNFNCLVIPRYEISLFDYARANQLGFSNIKKIMIQMVDIFTNIHSLFVLHRDIKPQNIMIFDKEIYLIDFGLASFYINENGEHCNQEIKDSIVGTSKYISLNIHQGSNASRRDDLISLGFVCIFLCLGSLPWDNIEENTEIGNHYEKTHIEHPVNRIRKTMKQWHLIESLICDFGEQFTNYMRYCYNLEFDETPNYTYLRSLFLS